jgi:Ca2+/Na+ antiporter
MGSLIRRPGVGLYECDESIAMSNAAMPIANCEFNCQFVLPFNWQSATPLFLRHCCIIICSMPFTAFIKANAPVLLLAMAAAGWYAASHAAAGALAGTGVALRRRILGHWLPVIVTALLAALAGYGDIAVGVLFATSVAVLSLVLGIVTCTHDFAAGSTEPGGFPVIEAAAPANVSPIGGVAEAPAAQWRRLWAFVLPAALLALLAGFSGFLSLNHALALLTEGVVILALWTVRGEMDHDARNGSDAHSARRGAGLRAIEMILAVAVAAIAAWAGLRAVRDLSSGLGLISGGFVTVVLVAPALVLPMIGTGMALTRAGLYHAAVTSSVGIVLLNLCFGLPLVIGIWHSKPLWSSQVERMIAMVTPATTSPATVPAIEVSDPPANEPPKLRYPLPVWRVDTVILILLGLVLLPLSVGRWMPGRFEGVLLICVYMIYLILTTLAARS